MARVLKFIVALLVLIPLGFATDAAHAEKRIALVIGNAGYQVGPLSTPANDAGLIAQTFAAAMSALPPKADIRQRSSNVCSVRLSDIRDPSCGSIKLSPRT
jgi:hypothetical protein